MQNTDTSSAGKGPKEFFERCICCFCRHYRPFLPATPVPNTETVLTEIDTTYGVSKPVLNIRSNGAVVRPYGPKHVFRVKTRSPKKCQTSNINVIFVFGISTLVGKPPGFGS